MTMDEIQAQWVRYMHRNDLTADLDATTTFARNMIWNRMMGRVTKAEAIDEILQTDPHLWLNAGLIWLAQLAMDNDTLSRSMDRFRSDMDDYLMQWSINYIDPVMIKGVA